ncbi:hypothetical protein AnigIFM63309_009962 [Aspergillus niger]|nr:hypothetical protein AnigIFM63309_009962 [Aspergillus niger]
MAQAETAFWAANPKFGLLVRDQTISLTVSRLGENGRLIAQVPVWIQLQDATSLQEVSTLIQDNKGDISREEFHSMYAKDPERTFDMILRVLNYVEIKTERAEIAVDDLTTERDALLERVDNLVEEKDNMATE